ncbi:torso-like protein [Nilaparvata lugens]|uniref:torso-like protein n=1 Tax=Nilaparvata lugens TaxID=108931 RepID=UPI00193C9FED|nr:torso-like protein [Nilaparvata lugens]
MGNTVLSQAFPSYFKIFQILLVFSAVDTCFANIRIGFGIDVFKYWGDLGSYFNDDHKQVLSPVFKKPYAVKRHLELEDKTVIRGAFQIELCRDVPQLLEAFFRPYIVERSSKSWKIFSSNWSKSRISATMGVNSTYLTSQYGFAYIRISRYQEAFTLDPTIRRKKDLLPHVAVNTYTVMSKDSKSVMDFFTNTGSHYIQSYVTGDALYQVFVFSVPNFLIIQDEFRIHGPKNISADTLSKYMSPYYAENVGDIMVASGNPALKSWASKHFLMQISFLTYPSLVKLQIMPGLAGKMDPLLGNKTVLQLELKSLEFAFRDPKKKRWYQRSLDNYLKLWEENG